MFANPLEIAEMQSLFPELDTSRNLPADPFAVVVGLSYCREFISRSEEADLMEAVAREDWDCRWSRRTQFYGLSYAPGVRVSQHREMPLWSVAIGRRLVDRQIVRASPTQIGVNEYLPGQGIAPHIDYSGGYVVSLSLGSGCIMEFSRHDQPAAVEVYLEPRSIVVLQGEARDIWKHGIPGRKSDRWHGRSIPRSLRVSITFRNISSDGVSRETSAGRDA